MKTASTLEGNHEEEPKIMIEARNLGKEYDGCWVVEDLCFNVNEGEIFGLLGPNGAGKTTTIRMLTGQLEPSAGIARISGMDPFCEHKQVAPLVNMVFERQNLYGRLSAYDNLLLFQRLYGVPHTQIESVLEIVGLSRIGKQPVRTYSNGMRQRLVLARALLNTPKVLFLDEPTRGLDPVAARHIRDLLVDFSTKGMTVLLTTQYVEEADRLCHRVAFLCKGEIVALDPPAIIKRNHGGGRHQVKVEVEWKSGRGVEKEAIDLTHENDLNRLLGLLKTKSVLTLRSSEPSLEDVFIHLTGEELSV